MPQSRVATIGSSGALYYTAKELQRQAKVSPKTFAYLRDTLGLIPKPFRTSSGHGVQGYYPPTVAAHLTKIETLHRNGQSYPQIAKGLKDETPRLFQQWYELLQNCEMERDVRRRLARTLTASDLTDLISKMSGSGGTEVDETKLRDLKRQVKAAFRKWDGESLGELKRIRGLIDRVQEVETTQRLIAQTKGNSA